MSVGEPGSPIWLRPAVGESHNNATLCHHTLTNALYNNYDYLFIWAVQTGIFHLLKLKYIMSSNCRNIQISLPVYPVLIERASHFGNTGPRNSGCCNMT